MSEESRGGPALRVLTIGPAPAGPESRGGMASVMTLMRDHPDPRIEMAVVVTYVDASPMRKLRVGLGGMLASTWQIATGRVDLLHVHLAHGGSVVRKGLPLVAARLRGVPSVIHAHSYDFAGWFEGLRPMVQRLVRAWLPADRWVVLGSSHVEPFAALLRLPLDRFEVLHNPAVLPDLGPRPDWDASEPVVVVSLGRLGVRKGSYDVVTAVAALPIDVRDRLHVVLAGDGENDEVVEAAAAAGVSDVVEVRGWQGPEQRDALMNRAQVFVLPSYDEGLPMALLEAMGRGLAPIVTPVGGIPNVVTDDREGVLVPPGDTDALAAALDSLVRDAGRRRRLQEQARHRSEDFDVDRWYARLVELWFEVARR